MKIISSITVLAVVNSMADHVSGHITFNDIASDPASGLSSFRKHPSSLFNITQQARDDSLGQPIDFVQRMEMLPAMGGFGLSGVAVLDFDSDGDLDLYVANGDGAPNSLYSNQLVETGTMTFVDMGQTAGVDATPHNSHGVCYGDIDNDGDPDLVVLGGDAASPNLLFENMGDGTFIQVVASGIESLPNTASGCSFGDVNGDGLVDLVVGNSCVLDNHVALSFENFDLNFPNQLFQNNGDNTFTDISVSSGILNNVYTDPANNGKPGITWAVAMVDIDLDGDMDIIFADDQGGHPEAADTFPFPPFDFGTDRGVMHVFLNDGSGFFTDQPIQNQPFANGGWMGLSFGDFNCDGKMDMFGANFGDYAIVLASPLQSPLGRYASRWFFGNGDGTFADPGVGQDIVATPFGWGTETFDYDNDGDQDVVFYGGIDLVDIVSLDNQGTIYENDQCSGNFKANVNAVVTDHSRRSVRALAVGDLNQDGFPDIVVPSEMNIADDVPLTTNPGQFNGPYDSTARFAQFWENNKWNGATNELGDLVVEMNSGNTNGWVAVTPLGSFGLAQDGTVNRDAYGAVLYFKPDGGNQVLSPVVGGASYTSQSSREQIFGLGSASEGTLEVMWPGGVRNRLYNVANGERVLLPEIPCTIYSSEWPNFGQYVSCVTNALGDLRNNGIITYQERDRFLKSAKDAFGP